MAAGQIIVPGAMPTRDRNGRATVGKLFFYEDGTQTPAPVYATSALTTALANPVVSDAAGRFPAIWADDAELFTVVWTYDDEETIKTYSGVSAAEDAVLASVALAQAAADEAAADAVQTAADLAAIQAIEAAGSTAPAIAGKLDRDGSNVGIYAADLRTNIGAAGTAALAATSGSGLIGNIGAGTGAVARTVQARLRDEPSPFDYGVVGDGTTDDTLAWQAYLNYCYANQRVPRCPRFCKSLISDTLTILPQQIAVGVIGGKMTVALDLSNVLFIYSGTRNKPAIDIGVAPDPLNPGANYFGESYIGLPSVVASGFSVSWPVTSVAGSDMAIRLRRTFRCKVDVGYVVGFSKGIEINGCAYTNFFMKHIVDCKYGLVLTTEGTNLDDSFTNENNFYGGRYAHSSNSNGLGAAAMVVFTWDKSASYRGHNSNRFYGSCFESGGAGSGADRIPVWFDGVGAHNCFRDFRTEGTFGVIAICDGAGPGRASGNEFTPLYGESAGLELAIQQVGGAAGNIVTGPRGHQSHWHSGDMGKLAYASGDDKAAIRGREFFYAMAGTMAANTPSRIDPFGGIFGVRSHRRALLLEAGGYARVGVAIDTSVVKDFLCEYSTVTGTIGRPAFVALDANGAILSGTATETATNPITGSTFANELYVKGINPITASAALVVSGTTSYSTTADQESARAMFVTVRPEVKTVLFMILGASARVGVYSMSVTSYGSGDKVGTAYPTLDGISALRVFNPLDDGQEAMRASANPGTSGIHGFYTRGDFVGNSAGAVGAPSGWTCTTTGWLAIAWAISTAYDVPGMLVTNDSGKIYELVTAGTSAGSGGPTGTGSAITDGTCVWKYIGVKAVFAATPNLV